MEVGLFAVIKVKQKKKKKNIEGYLFLRLIIFLHKFGFIHYFIDGF